MSSIDHTWYVAFGRSDDIGWWKIFTKNGFEHVLCFAGTTGGVITSNFRRSRYEILFDDRYSVDDYAISLNNEGYRVLRVTGKRCEKTTMRGIMYCVTIVKACLTLNSCWAVTPYGLFKWLKKSDLSVIDLTDVLKEN